MNDMSDRDLALFAAKCYFGIDEENEDDCHFYVVDDFKRKLPPGGFIDAMEKELPGWWNDNIGHKSRVARMSMVDLMHHINKLRVQRGSDHLPEHNALFNVWMEHIVSKYPDIYLVEVWNKKSNTRKRILINTGVRQQG
ncbi:MAG: hypothetical protein BME93_03370 [Methanosarcinales archaeon Met12]|nr:MAG: hypothetical protein BME93_03370 [Methanosarcinales archaeon Met12]